MAFSNNRQCNVIEKENKVEVQTPMLESAIP